MKKTGFVFLFFIGISSCDAMMSWLKDLSLWPAGDASQRVIKREKKKRKANFEVTAPIHRARNNRVPKARFFEDITGVTEAEFRANPDRYSHEDEDAPGHYFLTNAQTGKIWDTGTFSVRTVAELQAAAEDVVRNGGSEGGAGTFNVVVGYGTANLSEQNRRRLDVAALQANPRHNGAIFQVASNFDCKEGQGANVTAYANSVAQGQAAAVSAGPGTIARVHLHEDVDLLEAVADLPAWAAGGLSLVGLTPAALQQAAAFDYRDMAVGIQLDTDVAFGFISRPRVEHEECLLQNQQVTQFYTSGLNLGINPRGAFSPAGYVHVQTVAKKALRAAYAGAIYGAKACGNQRARGFAPQQELFLTPVGCGVFGNEVGWVTESLEPFIDDIVRYGLKVTLIVYDAGVLPNVAMQAFLVDMRRLVAETGGYFEEVR